MKSASKARGRRRRSPGPSADSYEYRASPRGPASGAGLVDLARDDVAARLSPAAVDRIPHVNRRERQPGTRPELANVAPSRSASSTRYSMTETLGEDTVDGLADEPLLNEGSRS